MKTRANNNNRRGDTWATRNKKVNDGDRDTPAWSSSLERASMRAQRACHRAQAAVQRHSVCTHHHHKTNKQWDRHTGGPTDHQNVVDGREYAVCLAVAHQIEPVVKWRCLPSQACVPHTHVRTSARTHVRTHAAGKPRI